MVQCDSTTAGRIIRCGSWEAFCAWKDEKARKERERNRKAEPAEEQQAEKPLPGQIEMELGVAPYPEPVTNIDIIDQTKLMRFQAAQVDKMITKLDKLNDTLSMILRAVRKE